MGMRNLTVLVEGNLRIALEDHMKRISGKLMAVLAHFWIIWIQAFQNHFNQQY
jgi:hypothetical protein